jgi:hypothetical protein
MRQVLHAVPHALPYEAEPSPNSLISAEFSLLPDREFPVPPSREFVLQASENSRENRAKIEREQPFSRKFPVKIPWTAPLL